MSETGGYRPLSPSERDCFSLLAQGYTSYAIANRLILSPYTVETHIRRAMTKYNARNRAHLVYLVMKQDERIRMQHPDQLRTSMQDLLSPIENLEDALNVGLSAMAFAIQAGAEGRGAVIDHQRSSIIRGELLKWIEKRCDC